MTMTAQCLMNNCRNKAPDGEAMCSQHRDKGLDEWQAGYEAGVKAAEARARLEGAKAMEWPEQWPLGTRVRKRKGSSWQGRVVGYYSTDLTPRGYAVESEREPGSVQIYPKAALEALDPAQIAGGGK